MANSVQREVPLKRNKRTQIKLNQILRLVELQKDNRNTERKERERESGMNMIRIVDGQHLKDPELQSSYKKEAHGTRELPRIKRELVVDNLMTATLFSKF